jgi:hypothetical protein
MIQKGRGVKIRIEKRVEVQSKGVVWVFWWRIFQVHAQEGGV